MSSIFDREGGTRWPRGQKFQLSPEGLAAEAAYQAVLLASRETSGRASFDQATNAWAAALGLVAGDAGYLSEMKEGPRTIVELVDQMQHSGGTKEAAKLALDRLIAAKLAGPVAH